MKKLNLMSWWATIQFLGVCGEYMAFLVRVDGYCQTPGSGKSLREVLWLLNRSSELVLGSSD